MAKIYVINVGANTAHAAQARSAVWPDGRFEFVTFPDPESDGVYIEKHHDLLSTPSLRTHADPDLNSLTYGDFCGNRRARALLAANPNDVLLFWALLWRVKSHAREVWETEEKGWYLVAALRIQHVLESGQSIKELGKRDHLRAQKNAHVNGNRVETRSPVRVFLGDPRYSAKFGRAVDLGIYDDAGLLRQVIRSRDNRLLQWQKSPRWNCVTRSCRAVLDLTNPTQRSRAEWLNRAIRAKNPRVNLF